MLAAVPAVALIATGLTVAGAGAASDNSHPRYVPTADDYYINYAEPKVERQSSADVQVGTAADGTPIYAPAADLTAETEAKFSTGNPRAGRVLAKHEQDAIQTGKNPRDFRYKNADETQVAQLLTILIEFNDEANDDFTGTMVPMATFDDDLTPDVNERDCVPGNVQNGPLHNNIPDPADAVQKDNNSMWVPDFSPEFYDDILYTEKGYTERVRKDLKGPDGKKGISLRGYTMSNMYLEMSKGAYTVDGAATPWVEVPHSEAWYGANTCVLVDGVWVAGASQSMNGHPDNPAGPGSLGIDAVNALAEMDPDFPWADYDIEDVSDADGDGNFLEPDGVIDHLVLVHAGEDKSGGGGAQGPYAIWAHSSAIVPGYTIPGTDIAISNYIVQPEDSGVGVFAHEYGHDLGLPDLYDIGSGGDSDVDFWDLMAAGSHTGPVFQAIPTHMGIWDKWVLGWAEPKTFEPGDGSDFVLLGQTSRTPKWTEDGIRVVLPDKVVTLADPHSGENMWYSSNDQSWADVRLTNDAFEVPAGPDVRFWTWNNYVIEADWDFGFIEVSTDGGATFEELKVFNEDGSVASTDDDYPDPNGRMSDYGGKKYGIHGDTGGAWEHYYVDLTPYAGQTVQLRLRYATDAGFEAGGWFVDDLELTANGTSVWVEDVESGSPDWTPFVTTFTTTTGAGWVIDTGTSVRSHYYLAEWRNHDGFDEGLKYAYDTNYLRDGAWKVERTPYNAPGMLVWYRDTTYGNVNLTLNNLGGLPSHGTKGGLLIVDSHFDPLRRQGEAADKDPSTLNNLPSRPQSSNAAFTLNKTYKFTECFEAPGEAFSEYCTDFGKLNGVSKFTDSLGWYPGIEVRGTPEAPAFFYKDIDASVVIASNGTQPYSVRVTDQDSNLLPEWYGVDLGLGQPLGTGNPGDDGVAQGVEIQLLWDSWNDEWALVKVTPAPAG